MPRIAITDNKEKIKEAILPFPIISSNKANKGIVSNSVATFAELLIMNVGVQIAQSKMKITNILLGRFRLKKFRIINVQNQNLYLFCSSFFSNEIKRLFLYDAASASSREFPQAVTERTLPPAETTFVPDCFVPA